MNPTIIQVEGKTVSYTEWGNKKKPVLVCLHGLAGSARYSFSVLHKYLCQHFRMIAIDQPGHGLSDSLNQESDYLFSNMAKWYKSVFTALGLKSFYLAGHSWGADVALHFAKLHPETVEGLVLLDGAFTFPHFQDGMTFEMAYEGWNQYMDNAKYSDWQKVVQEYKGYTKNWTAEIEQAVQTIFTEDHQLIANKITILSIIKAFYAETFVDAYPHIKMPVLLIHATEPRELDPAREKGIKEMKEYIKDFTIIPIKSGHMLQWDEPEKVAEELINFATKLEALEEHRMKGFSC